MKITMLSDILKETKKDGSKKYSQARVYTFCSVFFYFTVHVLMALEAYSPKSYDVNVEILRLISQGLYSAMLLFCGYTFGGKFIDVVNKIKSKKEIKDEKL